MIDQHSITPPLELVNKWGKMLEYCEETDVFSDIARWGADQELEACCKWLCAIKRWKTIADRLRSSRRPKPSSLREQALALVNGCNDPQGDYLDDAALDIIRRALEALPDSQ